MTASAKPAIVQANQPPELSERLMAIARETPIDDLPALIGTLESVKALAWSRLTVLPPLAQHDELISTAEAAQRLGVSEDYLYRHHGDYSFTRQLGGKRGNKLLFSALGIEKHIRQQRP